MVVAFSPTLDAYPMLIIPGQRALGYGKYLTGHWSLSTYPVMSSRSALLDRHQDDAHITPYLIQDKSSKWLPHCPRLTKSAVEWTLEAEKLSSLGREVLCCWLIADFDTDGHAPLESLPDGGKSWLSEKKAQLASLSHKYRFARYTTRSGGRVIAPLSVPLSPPDFESLATTVVRDLRIAGIKADEIEHWTALFRLPRVRRTLKDGSVLDLESLTSFGDVQPIDSHPFIGVGAPQRTVRVVKMPKLPPLPGGADPFALVGWSGAEALRDKLLAGQPIGRNTARYLETRAAVATVSARMREPRSDVVTAIFKRSIDAMVRDGSVITAEEMPTWIDRVTESDRASRLRESEEAREIIEALSKKHPPAVVESTKRELSPQTLSVVHNLAKRVVRGARRRVSLAKGYSDLVDAGIAAGSVAQWLGEGAVLYELKKSLKSPLACQDGEGSLLAGVRRGAESPADLLGAAAHKALDDEFKTRGVS